MQREDPADRRFVKYEKMKELLDLEETFPTEFTYKFIGQNSALFKEGIAAWFAEWSAQYPTFKMLTERESAGGAHLALTYTFRAPSSDVIIAIFRAIEKIPDIRIVL